MQATFSIGVVDPSLGIAGVATASRYPAVGALVIHAVADAGVVITQSIADRNHAERAMPLLAAGIDPGKVLQKLLHEDPSPEIRQIALVRRDAATATHTGVHCVPVTATVRRTGLVALGNMLTSDIVPAAMADAYTEVYSSAGTNAGISGEAGMVSDTTRMAGALVAALRAGERAGGDKRGKQAAALLVVGPGAGYGGRDDRAVDLRVDDHPDPVEELARICDVLLSARRAEEQAEEQVEEHAEEAKKCF